MRPEEILKQLSGLKTDKEREEFLRKLLKEEKDSKVKLFLESIVKQLSQRKQEEKPQTIEELLWEIEQGPSAFIEAGDIEFGKYIAPAANAGFELPEEKSEKKSPVPYIPLGKSEAEAREMLDEREKLLKDYERGSSEAVRGRAESLTSEIRRPAAQAPAKKNVPMPDMAQEHGDKYKRMEDRRMDEVLGAAAEFTESIRGGSGDDLSKKKRLYLPKEEGY